MFPDVPLKQLRYSALVMQKGGVGFYPASGIPFVHVDTGNVRHWPRMPRMELAALFPSGHSKHIPADGRPITKEDNRVAIAKIKMAGGELPWALTGKRAAQGPMLASLGPTETALKPQLVSLKQPDQEDAARPSTLIQKPEDVAKEAPEASEQILSEEGEEQEDNITFEPLPAEFLLSEKPLSYSEMDDHGDTWKASTNRLDLLVSPPSVLASEEFQQRLQIEDLYEANQFKGAAIVVLAHRRARMLSASMGQNQATQ
jgi:hypothetical protein